MRRFICAPEGAGGPGGGVVPAAAFAAPPAIPGERWIDIHCHLFNVLDIPTLAFISRTRLTMPLPIKLLPLLGVLPLIGGLNGMAMTAKAELAALREGADPRLLGPVAAPLETETALRIIAGRPPAREAEAAFSPLSTLFAGRMNAMEPPPPPKEGAEILRDIANEELAGRDPQDEVTDDEIRLLAGRLEHEVARDRGGAETLIAWAQGMARSRDAMTGALLSQFPPGADVLLTPAMVDYSRWLGVDGGLFDPDPISKLDDQVAVMGEISRRRANGVAVGRPAGLFSIAPFCPWRHVEDLAAGRMTILERIKRWVASGQVVGVKVYPPMGFRPTGNSGLPAETFPSKLRRLAGARNVGGLIDDGLHELYAWCAANEVPVMAHCGNSNEAAKGAGLLAGPNGWSEVLVGHPSLRLNLAHFGGVYDLASDDPAKRDLARKWTQTIAALMTRFDGLYADIGFASQMLDENPRTREILDSLAWLRQLADARPVLMERLMYGSDWVMVGMTPGGGRYAERVKAALSAVFTPVEMENIRWRNAARMLGLGRGEPGQVRMQAWLAPHAPGLLSRFDPASA
ncbi:MAG: amidohydrolase family protein [Acetobacteraceae bacterium]|nr:amidohydrolase family protein [Acetobacteraceae bacterium]